MSLREHFRANPADSKSNHNLLAHLHSEFKKILQRPRAALPEKTLQPEVSRLPVERVALNLFETDKGVDIEFDLSGFDSEEVKVSASKNCLIIEACAKETSHMNFYLGDPTVENIRKVIPLGFSIGKHAFRKQHRNGMLAVHIDKPNVEVARRKQPVEA